MNLAEGPLVGPPPTEVPLAEAPLIRVIAQVRFPIVASIESRDFIAAFQEAVRSEYPVLRPEETQNVSLGDTGVSVAKKSIAWRFESPKTGWRLTLAPDFLALETRRYTSRDDFMGRFKAALTTLVSVIEPRYVDRLGVRFIDRVEGPNLQDLGELVRREVLGILDTDYLAERTLHSICEQVFSLPEEPGHLMARWGLVPANATVDPAGIDPIDAPSWLLDLDAFRVFDNSAELDVESTVALAISFTERIYKFFRWVVEDELLRRYGGDV